MNRDGGTIGSFELYSILYLSRLIGFLTYSLSMRGHINTGDRPIMTLFFLIFTLVLSIPALLICNNKKNTGLISEASSISVNLAKVLSVLYAIFFLWYASASEARFDIFASTLMFSQSDITLYIAILTACAVYASYKGIEAIGRASIVFLFFLVGSLIFIITTISSKFDILNITPPLYYGISNTVSNGFSSSVRTIEPMTIMIVAPHVSGNLKKGFFRWLLLIFVTILVTFTLVGGVTGNYGNMQLFQMFTLTVLSGFSIFERLDALLSGLWVFCALIKVAYYILVALICIEQGFSVKLKKAPYIVSGVIVFTACKVISEKIEIFSDVISSSAIEISTLFFSVLFPLLVFILSLARKRKLRRQKEAAMC